MEQGPALVLDHMTLFGVLAEPAFWQSLAGAASALEPQGRAVHQQVVDSLTGSGCGGCTDARLLLTPIRDALGLRLAVDATARAGLAAYATQQRGYRPMPIVLYYNDAGGATRRLEF